jgi:hypothetical protein
VTWHNFDLALALLAVAAGLALIVRKTIASRRPAPRYRAGIRRIGPLPAHVSAHQLGLAHRFAARIIGSRWRPPDSDFTAVAELWPSWPIAGPFGSRLTAMWSPELNRYVTPAAIFLELEELLERLESLSARMRTWRPGRRRERS